MRGRSTAALLAMRLSSLEKRREEREVQRLAMQSLSDEELVALVEALYGEAEGIPAPEAIIRRYNEAVAQARREVRRAPGFT